MYTIALVDKHVSGDLTQTHTMTYTFDTVSTPLGNAIAVFSDAGLVSFSVAAKELPSALHELPGLSSRLGEHLEHDPGAAAGIAQVLERYFAGEDVSFSDEIIFDFSHLDALTKRVVQFVLSTDPGEQITYGEVAASLALPRAGRAIGSACRRSPYSIVVPFQRVVRADGKPNADPVMAEQHAYLRELENSFDANSR